MSETVKLNVINQTTDIGTADLVICQHNAAAGLRASPVAWLVLRNIAQQDSQTFELPAGFEIGARDHLGNDTPKVAAEMGQAYDVIHDGKGPALPRANAPGENAEGVELRNHLRDSDVEIHAYKSGRLLAKRGNLAPKETAAFQFHPHIYIGLAALTDQGDVMTDAIASRITTRINLFGVTTADIIMSSSEYGADRPIFRLENVQ